MSWLTLTVDADAQHADTLSEALLESGALAVDVHDADADTIEEHAIFGEPGEPDSQFWARNRVTALFPADAPVESILADALLAAGLPPASNYRIETLEDDDWVRLTQSQFDPIRISQRLWIVPTWHAASDPDAINIVVAVFFTICVVTISLLIAVFTLRRR
jgi:ribosomal protein L11 methyltransferase